MRSTEKQVVWLLGLVGMLFPSGILALSGCYASHRRGEDADSDAASGSPAVEIAVGFSHTCARLASGEVACWGESAAGQLGLNAASPWSSLPVTVPGVSFVTSLGAGNGYTCVVASGDRVQCWGSVGLLGVLGDGGMTGRAEPVTVIGLTGAVEVSPGDEHTCAREGTGLVQCWGLNDHGQLGDSSSAHESCGIWGDCALTPVAVAGLDDVTQLATGIDYTCALRRAGTVACWGANGYGQLGDGTTEDRNVPTTVPGLDDVVEIAARFTHTCALRSSGAVSCWGYGRYGQLGDGVLSHRTCDGGDSAEGPGDCSPLPVTVDGVNAATSVTTGLHHSCAVLADGTIMCWGSGDLGNGAMTVFSTAPVLASGIGDAIDVVAGGRHTCALRASGTVACWGRNDAGQLGDGTTSARRVPVDVQL